MIGATSYDWTGCVSTSDLDSSGDGSRTIFCKFYHIHGIDRADEQFRSLQFNHGWPSKIVSIAHFAVCRGVDLILGVTDIDRAQGHAVIQVALAVRVKYVATLAVSQNLRRIRRELVISTRVCVRSPGNHRQQPLLVATHLSKPFNLAFISASAAIKSLNSSISSALYRSTTHGAVLE